MTTNHPAPYMDQIFGSISERYDINIVYLELSSSEKTWKKPQLHFAGHRKDDLNLVVLIHLIRNADFILAGGWASKFNLKTMILGKLLGKRVAVFSDAPNIHKKNIILRLAQSILLRTLDFYLVAGEEAGRLFRKCYLISNSKKVLNFPYQAWSPDKEIVLKETLSRVSQIRQNGRLRIFIANRFINRKGYEDVGRLLRELKKRGLCSNFDVDIAGNGPLLDKYRDWFASEFPHIRMHGWVEIDEYHKLMLRSDIFLHCSKFEPYGIPVVDALNCGKQVIASDGVCSAIDAKNAGYTVALYTSGNHEQLTDLVESLYAKRETIYQSRSGNNPLEIFAPIPNMAALETALSIRKL